MSSSIQARCNEINVTGKLKQSVTAKDLIMFVISKLSSGGATGYFVEYAGEAIESLTMEGRMTVCNMSIEMGARGGLIAPDKTQPICEGNSRKNQQNHIGQRN
jgi:3-isopropylmalate/(R)-2-methylmalate dehydratase large subunit